MFHQDCANIKDLKLPETDELCDSLDIDDIGLSFESSYEMLGNQPRYNYEDGGIGSLLMEKNLSITQSNSTHFESAFEVHLHNSSFYRFSCPITIMPP